MVQNENSDVRELMELLKCHDHIDYFDLDVEPNPPNEIIKQISKLQVSILEEVESFIVNNLGKYSAQYGIMVLEKIHSSEATSTLLRLMDIVREKGYPADEIISAIETQGRCAIKPTLEYAAKARERQDMLSWHGAMEGLEQEGDPKIVDELLEGLKIFDDIAESIISLLAPQRDIRCVEPIVSILRKDPDLIDEARRTLLKVLSPKEYNAIMISIGSLVVNNEKKHTTHITIDLSEIDIEYDSKNNIIYVSFGKPQEADDSEMFPNGIVVRYRDGKPIGLTVVGTKTSKR